MIWRQLEGLKAVLAYTNGRQAVRESQERIPALGVNRTDRYNTDGINVWCNATVIWFEGGEGLACFVRGDGPPYSDVTPDPAWDAAVFYWAVTE